MDLFQVDLFRNQSSDGVIWGITLNPGRLAAQVEEPPILVMSCNSVAVLDTHARLGTNAESDKLFGLQPSCQLTVQRF